MGKALCFIFGAVAGTAFGYYVARQRCEEEIESVKEAFKEKHEDDPEEDEPVVQEESTKERKMTPAVEEAINYMHTVRKAGYSAAPDPIDDEEDAPYEITALELGDIDYEQLELVLFADGVLADGDTYDKIDDIDNIVGEENLSKFGHYEEDRVCVRNDRLKCDYEIVKDERTYAEAYAMLYPYKSPIDEGVED